jgi:predicted transcriptional regulator
MKVIIEVPDEFAAQLQQSRINLPQKVLEVLVVEAYREDLLTRYQVGQILGLSSRFAVDQFLKQSNAYWHYDEQELEDDRQAMASFVSARITSAQ